MMQVLGLDEIQALTDLGRLELDKMQVAYTTDPLKCSSFAIEQP